jgi:hypothetical protein
MAGPNKIQMGMFNTASIFKRPFRFMFTLDNVVGNPNADFLNVKPPSKTQRPSLSFKDITFEHLTETIHMPGKAEWKPINLSVYDIAGYGGNNCKVMNNTVYRWIESFYNPQQGNFSYACSITPGVGFKRPCFITLYDGGGGLLEQWQFDNAWCQDVNFGDLDMGTSDVMMIDMTLVYDRAYLINGR